MTQCLLCQTDCQLDLTFGQLLLFIQPQAVVCETCLAPFEPIASPHCQTCYRSGESDRCQDCLFWQAQGESVHHVSLYRYNDAMKAYFSRYKFEGDYQLRHLFSQELKRFLKQNFPDHQIIPIPLSQERLLERGFNQVTGWLDSAGLSYLDILGKHHIAKQSDKSRQERRQLQQPFFLKDKSVSPAKVVLIDDIYTTGSTLHLAKQLLLANGVQELVTLSLAR